MKHLRNILTFVLMLHLLIAVSGVPLMYHFCGEELSGIALGAGHHCPCDEAEGHDTAMHDGESGDAERECCRTELRFSQLETNIVPASSLALVEFGTDFSVLPAFFCAPSLLPSVHSHSAFREQPPPGKYADIPVLFRSLLI